MPRANRYIVPGAIYHVTHRCHDRSFLFRFAKDRNAYREMLRDRLERYAPAERKLDQPMVPHTMKEWSIGDGGSTEGRR